MTGRRRLLALAAAATLLAACESVGNIHTAATGTEIEARQVVALVYGQGPEAEIDRLPYGGGDLSRAVRRIRARFPHLKPWLDQGIIGNTAGGFVALRDPARREEVRELIRQENFDRAQLYTQASVAVGHGSDDLSAWLPYASHAFGQEWMAQAPSGWWSMDEKGRWQQR